MGEENNVIISILDTQHLTSIYCASIIYQALFRASDATQNKTDKISELMKIILIVGCR